jgi:hypothetical protein
MHESDSISCTSDTNGLNWAIDDFFWGYYGSGLSITKTMYDDLGVETTDSSLAVQSVYLVSLLKRISDISFTMSIVNVEGSTSTVSVSTPIQGSPPIQGKFVITCPDWDGVEHSTNEMGYSNWIPGINDRINNYIPHLSMKMTTFEESDCSYRENCVAITIFMDVEGLVPQCTIASGDSDPLSGLDLVYTAETVQSWGENIIY